jgi:hypothetical protein
MSAPSRHLGPFALCALIALTALAALGYALAAGSPVIYRWVDNQGKTHFSDTVPHEYKGVAKPVDSKVAAPAAQEQRQATQRLAELKKQLAARGAASAASSSVSAASGALASTPPLLLAPIKRPTHAPAEDADCETWRRLYQESLDCFGPYTTVGGGIKAEAFEACTLVKEPPSRCR